MRPTQKRGRAAADAQNIAEVYHDRSSRIVTDSVSGGTYRSESVCQYVFEFVCSVEFLPCGQEFSDVRDSRNACVAFGLLGFEVRMVGLEIATLWCANSSQPSSLTL